MVLLSGMMRTAAFTGSSEPIDAWFAGRQLGWWAGQWGGAPVAAGRAPAPCPAPSPARRPPGDAAAVLHSLEQLRESGVIDDGELQRLRVRLGV
jgi:hypothetical protein